MAAYHDDYAAQHPGRVYLDTPFQQKDEAKALGARWDPQCPRNNDGPQPTGMWFVPPHLAGNLEPFQRWLRNDGSSGGAAPAAAAEASGDAGIHDGYEPFKAFRERYAADAIRRGEHEGRGRGWCFMEQDMRQCPFQCHPTTPCRWRHKMPDWACDNAIAQRMGQCMTIPHASWGARVGG